MEMSDVSISPPASVHLIGVCGTGMGALAGLLAARGYRVTGSDLHAYPPMSEELERLGITIMEGYSPSNLDHRPDLVVIGNICKSDHPEAAAARERGLFYASMPRTVGDLFLKQKRSIVVAGTHGKTTTTSLVAFLLHASSMDPSFLIGGVAADFGSGFRLGSGDWFVIEGDEYDSAYFEKIPKFLSYRPRAAVITSVEHDHVDIYTSFDKYKAAFSSFAGIVPQPGPVAVFAGDAEAVNSTANTKAEVVSYCVEGDAVSIKADWLAVPIERGRFDLVVHGEAVSQFETPLGGRHNLRNVLAALIMCNRAAGVPLSALARALPEFKGVKRRQEVVGRPGGVTVYDDFAHHPTAVEETLKALAGLHPEGRLLAAFEPRSATACRRLHQDRYASSFDSAGRVIIAPPGRDLPEADRLDTRLLARRIQERGVPATAASSLDEVLNQIVNWVRPGDGVALLSNGDFGRLGKRLVEALS
jgi:UDP-N-acetylmuramate: L-alanyl-gamma-D-glutamyl-meso-diaminopimelate ligase